MDGEAEYMALEAGVPSRVESYPIYEYPFKSGIGQGCVAPVCIMVDKAVIATRPYLDLLQVVTKSSGKVPHVILVEGGEASKTPKVYSEVLGAMLTHGKIGTSVVVGGGAILNSCGYAASTYNRGRGALIYVPTTTMAISDVAIGSKTSINCSDGGRSHKNIVGTYYNPTAVLLDSRYLDTLPVEHIKSGLVECWKHGICQSSDLETQAAALLMAEHPILDEVYAVAKHAMCLKSDVLSIDPWEVESGRILQYGHRAAHALEGISEFTLTHGQAVMVGIMLEAVIAAHPVVSKRIFNVAHASGLCNEKLLQCMAQLYYAIEHDARESGNYMALVLDELGQYGQLGAIRPVHRECLEADLKQAISTVSQALREYIPAGGPPGSG
jgi:3-dehydroquinate synthase